MWKNIQLTGIIIVGISIIAFSLNLNRTSHSSLVSNETITYEPIVVLELFTSQGCSSCPSADLLLQKVKKEYKNDVFALSYHVDYWNYIGWKDPFSKASYARKQRLYNMKFHNNSNYTPQLVVNGKEHFVGSNSTELYRIIAAYKEKMTANNVTFKDVNFGQEKISFSYHVQGELKNKRIRAMLVINSRATKVNRGENRNRTLQNCNIVVEESSNAINVASGSIEISIPKIVKASDTLNLIVLIENLDYEITGAAKQSLLKQI